MSKKFKVKKAIDKASDEMSAEIDLSSKKIAVQEDKILKATQKRKSK